MSFLAEAKPILLTIHILATAIGLGGATISDILFFRFLRDFKISSKEEEVLHVLKDVVLAAIFCITLSGILLYIPAHEVLNASPLFRLKALATGVLVLNGFALHAFVAPHLIHMNLRKKKKLGRFWYQLAFLLGSISVCSWYSVFFIAMLKNILPFSFGDALLLYGILLFVSIAIGQFFEYFLTKRASRKYFFFRD